MKLSGVWSEVELAARAQAVLRVGATGLEDLHSHLFSRWLEEGYAAEMHYLRKSEAIRRNPLERFPWARSVIALTVPYSPTRPEAPPDALSHGLARYALGDDYHEVLDAILKAIEEAIHRAAPESQTRRYVDTGPLSDRSYAAQAGLGWIGRNGMLLDESHGSYFFIGLLLTSLENDLFTPSVADRCGTCTRCVEACPTDAILPGRMIDSERCISYATIEKRGEIEDWMKPRLAGNVFGCDICQEVCPWNRFAPPGHTEFQARDSYRATPVTDLLRMNQDDFSTMFRKSAVKRAKRSGMIRNVTAAIGDAAISEVAPIL